MASNRRAAWYLCWWGCLFGVLPLANAAERINVPLPSVQDLLNRANPVINENSIGFVQAYDSAFQYQQRSYAAPIEQKVTIPKAAVKDVVKSGLRTNAAAVVANVTVAAAVAAAGWVIDSATGQLTRPGTSSTPASTDPANDEYSWVVQYLGAEQPGKYSSATGACQAWMSQYKYPEDTGSKMNSATQYSCQYKYYVPDTMQYSYSSASIIRTGSKCPSKTTYDSSMGACTVTSLQPVTDSDLSSLDVPCTDSIACKKVIQAACAASTAVSRCYQSLQDAASFLNSGPSTIQGPKSTSQTVSKNSDGTTTTATTTSDTKFNMKYDGTGATATPETTTTVKDGKGGESVTTDKEAEDSNSGSSTKPKDEDDKAVPCTSNCDGPAYKDLYTKTDVTKEAVLDTYAAKVKALPIMSAVGNFFTVNGGGSCPVWTATIDIGWGQSVTLSNDFACQPWFTALSPAFHAVLMLVGAWLAFRVSILD